MKSLITRTVFKKTGRKSGRKNHNTRFYISVPGNSLQDQSKDQPSIIVLHKIFQQKLDTQACAVAINLHLGLVRSVTSFDNI